MTTETKTEARERMSDEDFEARWHDQADDDLVALALDHQRARASEASQTAALSALRAEHQRVQEQAAAMLSALDASDGSVWPLARVLYEIETYPDRDLESLRGALTVAARRVRNALSSDVGKDWVSPEEHQRVVAERDELRHQRDELTRYIDEAKRACGDDRVTGEPLAQVIASLRSQLAEARKALTLEIAAKLSTEKHVEALGRQIYSVTKERDALRDGARRFPIQDEAKRGEPPARLSIPWGMIAPQEAQALQNHDQTLQRLAERGGLSPAEAICILEGRSWRDVRTMPNVEAREHLNRLVAAWEAEHGEAARLRAALAASEEKARQLEALLAKAHVCCDRCRRTSSEDAQFPACTTDGACLCHRERSKFLVADRAPSPSPSAGPATNPPTLTKEKVRELLAKAVPGARDLDTKLSAVFSPPAGDLRLGSAGPASEPGSSFAPSTEVEEQEPPPAPQTDQSGAASAIQCQEPEPR
jgi:hypothetical protein